MCFMEFLSIKVTKNESKIKIFKFYCLICTRILLGKVINKKYLFVMR